jgi:hypothetical protein
MQRVRKCSSKWSLNNQRFNHQSTHMKPNGQFEIMDYCKHIIIYLPLNPALRFSFEWIAHEDILALEILVFSDLSVFQWTRTRVYINNKPSHTSSRGAYEAQSHNEHFLLTEEDNSSAICWRVRKRSHRVFVKTDVSEATWSIPVREISDDCDQRTVTCCEIEH